MSTPKKDFFMKNQANLSLNYHQIISSNMHLISSSEMIQVLDQFCKDNIYRGYLLF